MMHYEVSTALRSFIRWVRLIEFSNTDDDPTGKTHFETICTDHVLEIHPVLIVAGPGIDRA
jgi:hypothetical protein